MGFYLLFLDVFFLYRTNINNLMSFQQIQSLTAENRQSASSEAILQHKTEREREAVHLKLTLKMYLKALKVE